MNSEAETKRAQAAIVTGQCVACHGILGMGDGTNPRIAGQSRGYVLKTLQEFQSKVRGNNPGRRTPGPLHPDDLVALAAFMAEPDCLADFGASPIAFDSALNAPIC